MPTRSRIIKKTTTVPGTIIECKSGKFVAYYEHRTDIIANGQNEREVKRNLKEMYDSIISYEEEEMEKERKDSIKFPKDFVVKTFKEKLVRI